MKPCNIVIADANCIHRGGITALLQKHFNNCIITEANSADALLSLLQEGYIDAVLAPVNLLPQNGAGGMCSLLQQYSGLRIILYSAHNDAQLMHEAFMCGACAFFYSDEPEQKIIYKTEQVLQFGSCIMPDQFNTYKAAHNRLLQAQQNDKRLTQREKEILQWIEKGNTTPQIAAQLFLSPNTVQNHRNNILRKTGCHNIAQVLLWMKSNLQGF